MDRKERVLTAAIQLFIQRGLERTPMSMIADKAGAGMGTIYRYFKDREDIINHLYVKIKEVKATFIFASHSETSWMLIQNR